MHVPNPCEIVRMIVKQMLVLQCLDNMIDGQAFLLGDVWETGDGMES